MNDQQTRLEKQARLHAEAVVIVAGAFKDTDPSYNAYAFGRAVLARLSKSGILIGRAEEFKE